MPATRSFTRVRSKDPVPFSRSNLCDPDDDVIIISSDEEDVSSTSYALKKAQQEVHSLKKRLLVREQSHHQVLSDQGNHPIEGLSSARLKRSEEERLKLEVQLQQAATDIQTLQSTLRLEKEARVEDVMVLRMRTEQMEKELESLRTVNQELHDEMNLLNVETNGYRNGNNALKELENLVLCEVCIDKLWYPYTLSGCGHTFCQRCLIDWFNAAIAANPHNAQYTCPTCRGRVHHKPVEDYTLKGIVRAILHAVDPVNCSPPAPMYDGVRGPWHRFFG